MSAAPRRTSVSTTHPAAIPPARLWAGVLLAPAAWIAQGSLGWYVGYESCAGLSVSGARVALLVLSAAAIAVSITGLVVAWGNWGRTTPDRHPMDIKGRDRVEFMSAGGVLVSGIFTIAIAWASLSALMLNACGGMR